tara:strand:- start:881 stop:1351 length:471 start_codon:yes stop_codon:yes gene_type:complete
MKRLLLPLLAALLFPTSVNANVDPEVHKLCLPAADYLGCVKAMTGDSNSIEVITNPGTATTKGNSCPFGYAYIGNGYCREVVCSHKGGQNAPVIAGKQWRCKPWGLTPLMLRLGTQSRVGNNSDCPVGEPEVGWNSTCDEPYIEPIKKDRIVGRQI